MRGSIAFGLVLRINHDLPDREIIQTTCLTIIVVTTILFGSTTGLMAKFLLIDKTDKCESKQLNSIDQTSNFSAKIAMSQKN